MKFLTASEVIKELKISKSKLYKWVQLGLPVIKLPGNTPRYDLDTVYNWLKTFEAPLKQSKKKKFKPDSYEDNLEDSEDKIEDIEPKKKETKKPENLPKGIYWTGKRKERLGIDYTAPTGRIREAIDTLDVNEAVQIRKQKIIEVWKNEPDSVTKERYLKDA